MVALQPTRPLPPPGAVLVAMLSVVQPRPSARRLPLIEMESESDRPAGAQPAEAQQVRTRPKEREARWRLELAETRTHPLQSTKVCFCPAPLLA